ncbi:MarR family winged helix-turn-helix transcriptional regulator [Cryptosporangium minutisporangium]|uniref:MarR family transcriptional regulator n=1 Tax=Cryptosporangium minutisporangium TaxID=113569 RepID=A0ABP6TED9_9ACTN
MEPETDLVERWRSLLTCYNEIACHLERALQDSHGLTLSEYETLDRLTTQECDKRRMQELAETMYLSQSALSRTVGRLVNTGLVERTHCEVDRRGVFVKITDVGRQRYEEARKTHLAVLAEHLQPAPV